MTHRPPLLVVVVLCTFAAAAALQTPAGDLQQQIDAAVASGRAATVRIPAATVVFNDTFLVVRGATAPLTIVGASAGSLLLFHPGFGILIDSSAGVQLQQVTLDYSPACFSQGRIVQVLNSSALEVEVAAGFPAPMPSPFFSYDNEVKGIFWDPASRTIIRGQPLFTPVFGAEPLPQRPNHFAVHIGGTGAFHPQAGQLMTISPRLGSDKNHAVIPSYCESLPEAHISHALLFFSLHVTPLPLHRSWCDYHCQLDCLCA